jgi:hypothetical protein
MDNCREWGKEWRSGGERCIKKRLCCEEKTLEEGYDWLFRHTDHPQFAHHLERWKKLRSDYYAKAGEGARYFSDPDWKLREAQRKKEREVNDHRRIAEGEALPWLSNREHWLDP